MRFRFFVSCLLGAFAVGTASGAIVMYGGMGGHATTSGPTASANDGALAVVSQTNAGVTIVGHPAGVARITGIDFDSLGDLFASTIGAVPFPPPPPVSTSSLDRLNPFTGAVLSSVPITDAGTPIGIADLAIQPVTNVLYGVSTSVGGTAPGQLYTINPTTGAATRVGVPLAFFTSIAFAPNGTLYEAAADFDPTAPGGPEVNPRLQVLNPATGAVVGTPVSTFAFFGAFGIRPTDSAIFGGTGDAGNIYVIDPLTGNGTLVGNTGLNFVGDLAFSAVPEPGMLIGTGLGLLLLAAVRARR